VPPVSLASCLAARAPSLAALALSLAAKSRASDDDGEAHKLWRWIEDNGEVVFPAIGVVILLLVVLAVRRGSLSEKEALHARAGQKEQVVRLLRLKLSLTAEQTALELRVDRYRAAGLLEEMERDGVLVQGRFAGGAATYRLKGL
jgi:hypothetical protein